MQALRELDRAAQAEEWGPLLPDQRAHMAQVQRVNPLCAACTWVTMCAALHHDRLGRQRRHQAIRSDWLQAMLRRLADGSADVVAVALGLPMLYLVPPAAMFEALASIVSRPSMPEKRRSAEDLKSQRGSARKVRDAAGARSKASNC